MKYFWLKPIQYVLAPDSWKARELFYISMFEVPKSQFWMTPHTANQNPGNLRMVGKLAEVGAGREGAAHCYWVKPQKNHCKVH